MSETTVNNQRAKLYAFMKPIIVVVIITIVLSSLTYNFFDNPATPEIPTNQAPFPEDEEAPGGIATGAILNMLFYVGLVFASGFLVLIIMKKGLMHLISIFFAGIMGISWFFFGLFYGSVLLFYLVEVLNTNWSIIPEIIQNFFIFIFEWRVLFIPGTMPVYEFLLYVFGILLGFLGVYSFAIQSFKKIWIRNTMMVFFGPMIGAMLAIQFGLLTTLLLLIGLSLYDIYAVFRGPLKGIIDHSKETAGVIEEKIQNQEIDPSEVEYGPLMPALPVYSTPIINIGLGDFAFFSVLISVAVIISIKLATIIPLLLTSLGLLSGAYYTFQYLKEDRALPGLPLPIFGGMGLMVVGVIFVLLFGGVTPSMIVDLFR